MPEGYDKRVKIVTEGYDERVLVVNGDVISTTTPANGDLIVRENGAWVTHAPGASSGVQPYDATLAALAALNTAANKLAYFTGSDTVTLTDLSAFARTILDDANAGAVRTTLGLDAVYQPLDATLTAVAAMATAADKLAYWTGTDAVSLTTLTAFARTILDDTDAATMRATLVALAIGQALPQLLPSGYYSPAAPGGSLSTTLQTANRIIAHVFPVPRAITIQAITAEVTTVGDAGRSVSDMVTNGTTTITSATAAFVAGDQGRLVTGTNIPNGTFIQTVTNGTTVVLTKAATGSGSGGTLTLSGPIVRFGIFSDNGGVPGALVFDSGISGTANNGGAAQFANAGVIDGRTGAIQEVVCSVSIGPGIYWIATATQGVTTTAPTLRSVVAPPWPLHQGTTLASCANAASSMVQQTSVPVGLPDPMVPGGTGTLPAKINVKVA